MVVIGAMLLTGFLTIAVVTVTSLTNGGGPPPPQPTDLSLPHGVEVIASHATCRSEACDGHGLVVDWDPLVAGAAIGMLVDHFRAQDWTLLDECAPGGRCMASDDLRVEMRPWSTVDPAVGTLMRATIEQRDLDTPDFVYIRLYRCGILEDC
jgi:hypothetical protein